MGRFGSPKWGAWEKKEGETYTKAGTTAPMMRIPSARYEQKMDVDEIRVDSNLLASSIAVAALPPELVDALALANTTEEIIDGIERVETFVGSNVIDVDAIKRQLVAVSSELRRAKHQLWDRSVATAFGGALKSLKAKPRNALRQLSNKGRGLFRDMFVDRSEADLAHSDIRSAADGLYTSDRLSESLDELKKYVSDHSETRRVAQDVNIMVDDPVQIRRLRFAEGPVIGKLLSLVVDEASEERNRHKALTTLTSAVISDEVEAKVTAAGGFAAAAAVFFSSAALSRDVRYSAACLCRSLCYNVETRETLVEKYGALDMALALVRCGKECDPTPVKSCQKKGAEMVCRSYGGGCMSQRGEGGGGERERERRRNT